MWPASEATKARLDLHGSPRLELQLLQSLLSQLLHEFVVFLQMINRYQLHISIIMEICVGLLLPV